MHRQQNEQVAQQVQQRVKRQQRERENTTPNTRALPVSVPRHIDQPIQTYAVHQLYEDFCFDASVGVFVVLPSIGINTFTSPFSHALKAAALAHSSTSLSQYGLLPKAKREYCFAVSTLKREITDSVQVQNDSLLVSIFLLGLFEVIPDIRSFLGHPTDLERSSSNNGQRQ